jgi:MoxR-like ATPase
MAMFSSPEEQIRAELERLDLLLHREILRLRAAYQLSLDEFRGLYISDQQVDDLIRQAGRSNAAAPDSAELTTRAAAKLRTNTDNTPDSFPCARLAREFGFNAFEMDVILLAIAPEIDSKYETLYAYLNNDVARKWPTIGLAFRLFADDPGKKTAVRNRLLPDGRLFKDNILRPVQITTEPVSWLAKGFSLSPAVSNHLLGQVLLDPALRDQVSMKRSLRGWDDLSASNDLVLRLRSSSLLFQRDQPEVSSPIIILEGRRGSGRGVAAEAVCRELGMPLLEVDAAGGHGSSQTVRQTMSALVLQQRLLGAGVLLKNCEALFDKEGSTLPESGLIMNYLSEMRGPVFLSCEEGMTGKKLILGRRHVVFRFIDLDFSERLAAWNKQLQTKGMKGPPQSDVEAIADRFLFTTGQIGEVVDLAMDLSVLKGEASRVDADALFEAARLQSDQGSGTLALKTNSIHTWEDLVLPPATLRQVKEVAAAARNRHIVYSQWGFERRIALGKGLKVLFSGSSGTGKTMTAGVIARELGLDLYKIDLSGIVSKYIGETEKNLDRVFRAARASNTILFFDEAEALFGKRSEVKDAHDRHANIEVAYLLMKLEEHEGVVILASNLSKNMDQAFSRRMHYVIDFPFPDEAHREKLWRGMFPAEAPVGGDVDFGFLGKQFEIAGGDIRNVALDAAFLAVQNGRVFTMQHLANALARQMQKQRMVVSPTDFKQYYGLVVQETQ